MYVAENLHITLAEAMQLSVVEIKLWSAYFKMKQEQSRGKHQNIQHRR